MLQNKQFKTLSTSNRLNLAKPFTSKEIKTTTWKLGAWNTLGPNDIPIGLYKQNWDLVENLVTKQP